VECSIYTSVVIFCIGHVFDLQGLVSSFLCFIIGHVFLKLKLQFSIVRNLFDILILICGILCSFPTNFC
jgi:hypothetical protein